MYPALPYHKLQTVMHTHTQFPIALPTHVHLIHLTPYMINIPYTTKIHFSAVSIVLCCVVVWLCCCVVVWLCRQMKNFISVKIECSSRQSNCALEQQLLLHCDDGEKYHILIGTRDLSHALPTITNSTLSTSYDVHPFIVTHNPHYRLAHSKFSLNLYSVQTLPHKHTTFHCTKLLFRSL
jgi:hypothetical protein